MTEDQLAMLKRLANVLEAGRAENGIAADNAAIYASAIRAALASSDAQAGRGEEAAGLAVWYGAMPESNGKTNWTAILHRGDFASGMTIDRSEYPDRVRYEADRVRWLIGELAEEPFILDYDADKHSGYAAPRAECAPREAFAKVGEAGLMPGASAFTMACFEAWRVPVGAKLYVAIEQAEKEPQ